MFSSDNLGDDITGNIRKQRHEHSPTLPEKNESENGRAPPNLMWFWQSRPELNRQQITGLVR